MNHASGAKISGSHTTLIDAAVDLVEAANGLDCVTKIVLGIIKQVKGAAVERSLKITDIPSGLRVKVRGSKTVQEIFIYTKQQHLVSSTITEALYKRPKKSR